MTKVLSAITILLLAGVLVARGQQTESAELSDADKSEIIEAVLDLKLGKLSSLGARGDFGAVSAANIEFIEPSRLSNHGLFVVNSTLFAQQNLFTAYLEFRKIDFRDGVARVVVRELAGYSRACFSSKTFPGTITIYTYECRRTSTGWRAQLVPWPEIKQWPGAKPIKSLDASRDRVFRFKTL